MWNISIKTGNLCKNGYCNAHFKEGACDQACNYGPLSSLPIALNVPENNSCWTIDLSQSNPTFKTMWFQVRTFNRLYHMPIYWNNLTSFQIMVQTF